MKNSVGRRAHPALRYLQRRAKKSTAAGCQALTEASSYRAALPRALGPASVRLHRVADYTHALGARFRNPDLALAAEHLAHVGARAVAREAFELLGHRIETHDRFGCPVRQPHLVIRIDPHRVGARLLARQHPLLPGFGGWIVDADVA